LLIALTQCLRNAAPAASGKIAIRLSNRNQSLASIQPRS
jgi:hypothetical protein